MSFRASSQSGRRRSARPASTLPRPTTTKSRKTNPYDPNFELHLIDHGVHPEEFSDEPELTEIVSKLTERRLSLSPSRFSDGDFKAFRQSNRRAKSEAEVLAHVVPTTLGSNQTMYPSARDTTFGNLERITDGSIVPAKPDIYDGAYPAALLPSVRKELFHHIVPSSTQDKPMAPNLFMEVKGPAGDLAVAMRQAQYNGAVGSRAVHTLQNYGNDKPQYDGQAYTFSSTYHGATLTIYAHHTTAPTTDGGRPEYHMTQVKAYALTSDRDTFVQGATALRNVRDLAKCHCDRFIQAANAKAIQRAPTAPRDEATALGALDGEGISGESVDCTGSPFPDTSDGAVHTGNCSQAPGLSASADTATSHISSVTSGFAAGSGKRPRQPLSPNSECNTKAFHTRVNI